jgi:hypothetical protein
MMSIPAFIASRTLPPPLCRHCKASEVGCETKRWLSGQRCCDSCDHDPDDGPQAA